MRHLQGRREMYKGFRWGNQKERDNMEDLGVNWSFIYKMYLKELGWNCVG